MAHGGQTSYCLICLAMGSEDAVSLATTKDRTDFTTTGSRVCVKFERRLLLQYLTCEIFLGSGNVTPFLTQRMQMSRDDIATEE